MFSDLNMIDTTSKFKHTSIIYLTKQRNFRINLPYIRQGYGMTETTLGVIITPYERLDGKSGTTGCVIPGMMVKVCILPLSRI